MSCSPDPEDNMDRAITHVREAAKQGAELVCLPELFQTQYFCQREDTALFELAEPIPGPATQRLADVTRELKITLIASLFERRAPGLYHNTAAILDPSGNLAGIYRKMHIPDDPLYYEKFYFTPGDLGFKAFDAEFGKFGTLVCWDQWYPEGARHHRCARSECPLLPHRDWLAPGREGTVRRSPIRCMANHSAGTRHCQRCLRCGRKPRGLRDGKHPRQRGSGQRPGILGWLVYRRSLRPDRGRGPARPRSHLCWPQVDIHRIEDVRRNWPFWRDRRIDAYAPITQRFLV